MPRLVSAHLIASLFFLITGVSMGVYMGMAHDFTLTPVHAHVNLLGWVTNALFGTISWLAGRGGSGLGWATFACFNAGVVLKQVGLAAILLGTQVPAVMLTGVLLVCVGILMFAGFVIRSAARA